MPFRTPRTEDLSPVANRLKKQEAAPLWIPLLAVVGSLCAAWAYAVWGG